MNVDHLLWLDLETTGSNLEEDNIIEIACVLTTPALRFEYEYTSLVYPSNESLGRMLRNSVVRDMHEINGLLPEVLAVKDNRKPHKVAQEIVADLKDAGVNEGRIVMAGSGVSHFDSRFVRKYMPVLGNLCRYWTIDIGVIRRAHEMWIGSSVSEANAGKTHRAIDDVWCHLEEARSYRDLWLSR